MARASKVGGASTNGCNDLILAVSGAPVEFFPKVRTKLFCSSNDTICDVLDITTLRPGAFIIVLRGLKFFESPV